MRATVPAVKKKLSLITNEKKRIMYYLSQLKGNQNNLDDDFKTLKKKNYKVFMERDELGQGLANEMDQDLLDDLALKNDMSKIKRGFNKRQAVFDYSSTMQKLKPIAKNENQIKIAKKARQVVRFLIFIIILNLGINLGKEQKLI